MVQPGRRQFLRGIGTFAALIGGVSVADLVRPRGASALCAGPKEGGRWWNKNTSGDPISVEVTLDDCGDQVLNGEQTSTKYGVTVFVKRSDGSLYKRPKAKAAYRKSNGTQWLYARVPTGGYVDNMWLRTYNVDGQTQLRVFIRHESLDSKPSSTSDYWFTKR